MSNTLRLFTIGTTTLDRVRRIPGSLTQHHGQKIGGNWSYDHAGGSGPNTAFAFEAIARAFGFEPEVTLCTKLGTANSKLNPLRRDVLKDIGHMNIIDACDRRRDYTVPESLVIVDDDDRTVVRSAENLSSPFNESSIQEIRNAASDTDITVLHSRYPIMTTAAASAAHAERIPVILDFSDKNTIITERLGEVIALSDCILAADDALLPGMVKKDPEELRRRFAEEHNRPFVAVSNSHHPVLCYSDGEYGEMPLTRVQNVDNLAAGDTRDGVKAFFKARGNSDLGALHKANIVTANFVGFVGRKEWAAQLPAFVRANPLFANDFAPGARTALTRDM